MPLGGAGLVVLVTGASDSAVGDFVRELEASRVDPAASPPLQVCFDAANLLTVPVGCTVVLVSPGSHARWLNLPRPVVAERRLTLLLWCDERDTLALRQNAPDFYDWISHRIELPPQTPAFVRTALHRAEVRGEVLALVEAPPAPAPWRTLPASTPYVALRTACAQGPVWVLGVQDALHWLSARAAYAEAGACHGLVFADPKVVGPRDALRLATPVPWAQAAALAHARGEAEPGLAAARLNLDPRALGVPAPPIPRLAERRLWSQLLRAARRGPTLEDADLATRAGLDEIALAWRGDAAARREIDGYNLPVQRAAALAKQADAHVRDGQWSQALDLLQREAIPVFERHGAILLQAQALGQVASILEAQGRLDEALRIRTTEQLPLLERAHARTEWAVARAHVAEIHQARGEGAEAERILRADVLPIYEVLGDVRGCMLVNTKIAVTHLISGDPARVTAGTAQLRDAQRLATEHGFTHELGQIRGLMRRFGIGEPDPTTP